MYDRETSACLLVDYRLQVPKKLTFLSELTKQCGVVQAMVDRWHHLVLLTIDNLVPFDQPMWRSTGNGK